MFYDAEKIDGMTSPGVEGTLAPTEALRRLLAGTGVTYSFETDDTVRLTLPGEGATVLSPITVEGERESPYGPVNGFVATRSASGTKTDTALVETPQSISVITADELKSRNVNKFNDSLRYTPGVESELYGLEPRFSHLSMRGLVSVSYTHLTLPTIYSV